MTSGTLLVAKATTRRPAAAAWRACLVATQENLDQQWRETVQSRFQSGLGTKYPFTRTQQSVAPADFTDFFGPGGTVDAFVTGQMAAYLESDRHTLTHGAADG